ncbi:MAG: adenine deaminase [Candidatus Krumholzibacteriota bacterium]|nr:adenine deaminase [Candidatus Krumholzibacteriota bacterium]
MSDLERRIAVAAGEEPADLVLKNLRLVNTFSGRVEATEIAVADGVVAALGEGYAGREEHDLDGAFAAPAFLDAHIHVESSMATPRQFARAVVPRGTGAVFADPHEIANVLGLDGVRWMLAASEGLPLDIFFLAPSCVPATHLESAGAELGPDAVAALLAEPRVLGLAEMMNFPGVIHRDPAVLAKLELAAGRVRDGHAPGLSGRALAAYAAAGIQSDHECTTAAEALARLSLGMRIMVREGSSARNLAALVPAITPAASRHFLLCSDDRSPADLLAAGHVDHLVRRAVTEGVEPVVAVQMATLNTARHFGLADRGALAPGYRADVAVFEDFARLRVRRVYRAGRLVAEDGRLLVEPAAVPPPPPGSMRIGELGAAPFAIADPGGDVRVIRAHPDQLLTDAERAAPRREGGWLLADPERDLLKLAVVERHRGTGRVGLGLVRGFGLRAGALATTVAHDSHNLIIVGADDGSMMAALAAAREMGGGKLVVGPGGVAASLPLPVAGLMSPAPVEETAARLDALAAAARELGCALPEPFMTLSFMALPVIPSLKLTDRGLVDVDRFEHVPLAAD